MDLNEHSINESDINSKLMYYSNSIFEMEILMLFPILISPFYHNEHNCFEYCYFQLNMAGKTTLYIEMEALCWGYNIAWIFSLKLLNVECWLNILSFLCLQQTSEYWKHLVH